MIIGAAILGIVGAISWVIAILDVVNRPEWDFPGWRPGSNIRNIWMLAVLILNLPASLAYYLLVMRRRPRQHR
jgi:hypothetical protein